MQLIKYEQSTYKDIDSDDISYRYDNKCSDLNLKEIARIFIDYFLEQNVHQCFKINNGHIDKSHSAQFHCCVKPRTQATLMFTFAAHVKHQPTFILTSAADVERRLHSCLHLPQMLNTN